jgi:selenocysteine lyase/cysteine desulfurase
MHRHRGEAAEPHWKPHGTQRADMRGNGDEASVSPSVGEFISKQRQLADLSLQRAPFELHAPVLRVSPHVDSATEDLEAFAEALAEATKLTVVITEKSGRSACPKG